MTYGILKVDTVTFTDAGVDKSVTLSGLVQNPTFSGNVTVTGTLSGVTVTGTTANFTSGNFTNISGGTHTITSGVFAAGSAANPSITFTGDLNTGIYSPGADQVAISTGGSGRLFINSAGQVGFGDMSFSHDYSFYQAANTTLRIANSSSTTASNRGALVYLAGSDLSIANQESGFLRLLTNGTERLRITSAGLVGVGTSNPQHLLHLSRSATTDFTTIRFSNTGASGREYNLGLGGNGTVIPGAFYLYDETAAAMRILVNSAGNVGIGTTSPATPLEVSGSSAQIRVIDSAVDMRILPLAGGSAGIFGCQSNHDLVFRTNALERFRCDTSGRLLVGTSSAVSVGGNFGATTGQSILVQTADIATYTAICTKSDGTGAAIALGKSRSGAIVSDGDSLGTVRFAGFDGTDYETEGARIAAFVDGTPGANDMPGRLVFSTTADGASSPTERLRITSAGLVGVGTSSPQSLLHLRSDISGAATQLYLMNRTSGASVESRIAFTTSENDLSDNRHAYIGAVTTGAGTNGNNFVIATNPNGNSAQTRVFVSSTGNIGIGTTSPAFKLDVSHSGDNNVARFYQSGASANTDIYINNVGSANNFIISRRSNGESWLFNSGTDPLVFLTNAAERARIDSSGRLLVGTSSARSAGGNFGSLTGKHIIVETTDIAVFTGISNKTSGATALVTLGGANGSSVGSVGIVGAGAELGRLQFVGADGVDLESVAASIGVFVDGTPGANDMPGRLVFSTTADGASSPTERMRIGQNGFLKASNSGSYIGVSAAYHELISNQGSAATSLLVANTNGTGNGTQISVNNDGTAYAYLSGFSISAAATRIIIWSNGNVVNTNNSYGAISDLKLKENIVDATSQWADIKALQVRKYNFKEGQTHTQIGLVAQEVELVSPGLVTESPDRDAEGNDLGTVTKSVNYSVLYMKAVKALQEAMERIEQLEQRLTDAGIA